MAGQGLLASNPPNDFMQSLYEDYLVKAKNKGEQPLTIEEWKEKLDANKAKNNSSTTAGVRG